MANNRRLNSAQLDAQLRLIAQGEKKAFEQLYGDTRAAVYSLCLSILKNRQDAEDAMHDCYLNLFTSAGEYRTMGNPMAWVLTVARNCSLQILRQHRREVPTEDLPVFEQAECSVVDRLALTECLRALDDDERQIVVLHAVAGYKHRESAQLLGIPLGTVLSKYRRAMAKLRRLL